MSTRFPLRWIRYVVVSALLFISMASHADDWYDVTGHQRGQSEFTVDKGSCSLVAQNAENQQQALVNSQNANGCSGKAALCGLIGGLQGVSIASARTEAFNACLNSRGWSTEKPETQVPVASPISPSRSAAPTANSPVAFKSKAGIELPPGWAPAKMTDQLKEARYLLFAKMPTIDAGLLFYAMPHEQGTNVLDLSKKRRTLLEVGLEDSHHSEIETLQINGKFAWRYEVFGRPLHQRATGIDLAYIVTLIDAGTELVELKVFSNKESFVRHHDDLALMANQINFTNPNIDQLNASAKEPPPPNEQNASFLAVAAKAKLLSQAQCNKPDYAPLYAKSACNPNEITFDQLGDSTKVTSEQKTLILKLGTERDALTKQVIDLFNNEGGAKGKLIADLLLQTEVESRKLRLALIKGDLTWGQMNQQRLALTKKQVESARNIEKQPVPTEPPAVPTLSQKSSSDRLRDIQVLYKDGVITKQDYETKKKEILDSM